jgi:hypothetical protein
MWDVTPKLLPWSGLGIFLYFFLGGGGGAPRPTSHSVFVTWINCGSGLFQHDRQSAHRNDLDLGTVCSNTLWSRCRNWLYQLDRFLDLDKINWKAQTGAIIYIGECGFQARFPHSTVVLGKVDMTRLLFWPEEVNILFQVHSFLWSWYRSWVSQPDGYCDLADMESVLGKQLLYDLGVHAR